MLTACDDKGADNCRTNSSLSFSFCWIVSWSLCFCFWYSLKRSPLKPCSGGSVGTNGLTASVLNSVIFAATPVGLSARESLRELLAVDNAGESRPPGLLSGVDVTDGSAP